MRDGLEAEIDDEINIMAYDHHKFLSKLVDWKPKLTQRNLELLRRANYLLSIATDIIAEVENP